MRLEDVERLEEAEDDVQNDYDDVEQTDAAERQLTVAQQLRQLKSVLHHRPNAEPYTQTYLYR